MNTHALKGIFLGVLLLAGACGGGTKLAPGTPCLVNSDCTNPLSCSYGLCHVTCTAARDCPTGQDCVKAATGNVCQLPIETKCEYLSQCMSPLVCALDRQCRSECLKDIDCPTPTQKCVLPDMVCAEPAEINQSTGLLKNALGTPVPAVPPDAGAGDGAMGDGGVNTVIGTPDYAWYVLDETQGSTAHDSSPNHFDITNLTGVTWDQGANFNESGCGYTTVTSAYRSVPLTISAWLTPNLRTDSSTHAIQPYPQNALSDDIPGVGGYSLGLNVWSTGSALAFQGLSDCSMEICAARSTQNAEDVDGGPSCTSAASCNQGFVAGDEYFVVVAIGTVGDAGALPSASVYVKGVLFDQTTAFVDSNQSSPPLYLGCANLDTNYGTARFFDGRIRDVRVYKRQLAADEVGQLYLNGPTLQAPAR